MASRPAFAALGCLQCRNHVLRAITSSSTAFARIPAAATTTTLRPRNVQRAFSSLPPDATKTSTEPDSGIQKNETDAESHTAESAAEEENADGKEDTPWFLQVEPPTHAPTQQVSPLPELPDSPPPLLEPLMKYVYEEMGLDDLSLLDLRALDPPPALGPNLLMLFATARSERHLHVSSSRLVKWLRYTHRIEANADGLIGPGELKTKLRRMRRKAKLLGSSAMATTGGDDGISTGWICVNLGTHGATFGEAARFDAEGNMSGFGGPVTGSTIVVQVMTEARRNELDLERLWSQQLIRSEAQNRKIEEDEAEFHSRFGKLPATTVRSRKGASVGASQQRSFSTSLVRSTVNSQGVSNETFPQATPSESLDPLREPREHIEKIRWGGAQATVDQCVNVLRMIFRTSSTADKHAENQADLAAYLLETMHERGMPVMDHEVLVSIIEGIAASDAPGDRTRQIQTNLEHLLLKGAQSCPNEQQLLRLLTVYARKGDWEKFWDTWSIPARYDTRKGPGMYHFVYSLVLRMGDKVKCIEILRKTVNDMLLEQPPVLPDSRIWPTLKACILLADPNAEHIKNHMTSGGLQATVSANQEFVKMLRELEAARPMA
ncbi:ATPase synthesis protein 25, mitochondrial [Colletotrichum chlorophyti]|uniref:ATPase synthesis protein 25 n=1 Tax=Colletotrichum chlorophyti TaxID=708187 RepID=A0A1Q8S2S2_9PEZI|nr:ATPase synthesis protein 25, mitochondrial [Colletotrichum chlorophyti]